MSRDFVGRWFPESLSPRCRFRQDTSSKCSQFGPTSRKHSSGDAGRVSRNRAQLRRTRRSLIISGPEPAGIVPTPDEIGPTSPNVDHIAGGGAGPVFQAAEAGGGRASSRDLAPWSLAARLCRMARLDAPCVESRRDMPIRPRMPGYLFVVESPRDRRWSRWCLPVPEAVVVPQVVVLV